MICLTSSGLSIEPLLPTKSRGVSPASIHRRDAEWHFLAVSHGLALGGHPGALRASYDLAYILIFSWREASIWDRPSSGMSQAVDGEIVMIDISSMPVHQHGASRKK